MIPLDETMIAMTLAGVGVVATLVWYALAWFGIRTLKQTPEAVSHKGQNNE